VARRSNIGAGNMQDIARADAGSAYEQALALPANARVEAFLLLAGQVCGLNDIKRQSARKL
jgi:hypothetical protein